MPVMVRPCAGRSQTSTARMLAATACALVVVLAGCSGSPGTSRAVAPGTPYAAAHPPAGSTYTLMQMNLCLSGLAGCYGRVAYPAGVQEAAARIRAAHPDAVTLNEACRGDAALIARRTGYHLRFSRVIYRGERLRCVQPGGRGLFGDAVLTTAAVGSSDNREFEAQAGIERRRWLCVTTSADVDVCTAHLASHAPSEVVANAAQCGELAALLARRAAARPVIFAGDVNRRGSCAPDGFWIRTDRSARHAAGLQQVYGSAALRSPLAQVLPATHTDHDVLEVTSLVCLRG